MSVFDLAGLFGALFAMVWTAYQIKGFREKRAKERDAAALVAAGAPEQRVSVLVSTAETAVVFLRNSLEHAEQEIARKDARISYLETRLQQHEERIRELERGAQR